MIRWVVRATYTFLDEEPSIEEIDRVAGGVVRHFSGGARHSVANGPWKTGLEWGYETVEAARSAVLALLPVSVLSDVRAHALERVLEPGEFQTSHLRARAGGAACPHCGARIEVDDANALALEGSAVGSEVLLGCRACDFVMGWQIVAD